MIAHPMNRSSVSAVCNDVKQGQKVETNARTMRQRSRPELLSPRQRSRPELFESEAEVEARILWIWGRGRGLESKTEVEARTLWVRGRVRGQNSWVQDRGQGQNSLRQRSRPELLSPRQRSRPELFESEAEVKARTTRLWPRSRPYVDISV